MIFRAACQERQTGESAVKCLSKGDSRIARVSFEPQSCQSSSSSITTLLTACQRRRPKFLKCVFSFKSKNIIFFTVFTSIKWKK